jgi:hypothetical protein
VVLHIPCLCSLTRRDLAVLGRMQQGQKYKDIRLRFLCFINTHIFSLSLSPFVLFLVSSLSLSLYVCVVFLPP